MWEVIGSLACGDRWCLDFVIGPPTSKGWTSSSKLSLKLSEGVLLSVSPWRRQQHRSSSHKAKEKLWLPQVGRVERGVQFIALFWTPFCEPCRVGVKEYHSSMFSFLYSRGNGHHPIRCWWILADGTLWVTKMKGVWYPPTKWVRRFRCFTLQTENCNFGAHFTCPFPISPLVTNYVLLSIILARSTRPILPRKHSGDGLGDLTWALQDLCLSVICGMYFTLTLLCPAIYSI